MMNNNFDISKIPDLAVISEAAKRLEKAFCRDRGLKMLCGPVEFYFEDGDLVKEKGPKGKSKNTVFVSCRRKRKRLGLNP